MTEELTVPLLSNTLLYLPIPRTALVICNHERKYKNKDKTLTIAECFGKNVTGMMLLSCLKLSYLRVFNERKH